MRIRYIALMATLAASLLSTPTVSACSLNPTAIISAPAASSSHIHGTAVGFNGSTSTANCGTIIGYLWKNGSTTLSTSPTFNYTVTLAPEQVDSVITVSLKVTSSTNARTHTVYRTITIKRDHQSQYFVKDHLGSPRVVVDGKGAVLSHTDYYPFGMIMPGRAGNISLSNDRVKFTGYLLEEEGEQDTYHAEARGYDPVIGRFTSRDPLAHLYPAASPYVYVLNNPLLHTDPTGMAIDDYKLDRKTGLISLIRETDDNFDVLYATDDQGNVDENTSITVQDQTILPQLAQARDDFSVTAPASNERMPGRFANTNNQSDAFNIFKFAAENSDVEWSYQRFTDGSLSIATANSDWITAEGRTHVSNSNKTIAADVHSHPVSSGRDLLPSGSDYIRARYFHRQNPNVKVQLYAPRNPDPRMRWIDIVNNKYIY
jgi:RHS repeat-associated protein